MTTNEIHNWLKFTHAIVRSDGQAYTGSVYGDSRDWTKNMGKAFAYTAAGASRDIAAFPVMFDGCKAITGFNPVL